MRLIRLFAENGKVFEGTDYQKLVAEVDDYEASEKQKREKEEAERKVKEEKAKKLTQYKAGKLKEIRETLRSFKKLVNDYEKETGNKLIFRGNLYDDSISISETRNSIDFAWDNFFDDINRLLGIKSN